jgi:hypothetical protein
MSNYPPGAQYDSSASWNQPDLPEWELEDITTENGMVIVDISWQPFDEDLPTRIELFVDDLFEIIEHKIY